ncbi:MAG: hypothetical protein J6T15_03955 [Bacilli bacterium]|nr:hypothetical protein [Bacilli bacterium]
MASNELGIRFTEAKYATKSEVIKDLRIQAIDSFWSNILAYRSQFNRYLNLKTIDRGLISLCCCSSINALMNNVENKILCLNREFIRIYSDANAMKNVTNTIFNRIATSNDLSNYVELLAYAYSSYNSVNGEDYLAELFSKLTKITEITHFYRTDDSVTKEKTALIDRIYKCAPSKLIEPMMEDLFVFANDMSLSAIAKFALIYFYMVYVRPFDSNSKELAMIYAKSVLAKDALGELAILLPFEEILFDDAMLESYILETQKSLDFTYFVKYFLEQAIPVIENMINTFKNMTCTPTPATSFESVQPVFVAKASVSISEKESATVLNKIETELIERDPNLKRKEAHFYSRHREIGKSYSIADYKRFSRCVYETARTSMDHLAQLGYYKKIQIKNKFVYETVER